MSKRPHNHRMFFATIVDALAVSGEENQTEGYNLVLTNPVRRVNQANTDSRMWFGEDNWL